MLAITLQNRAPDKQLLLYKYIATMDDLCNVRVQQNEECTAGGHKETCRLFWLTNSALVY
jgi:hypothetical protein